MISSALLPLQMKRLLLTVSAMGAGIASAESFRISQVVAAAGDGVEEMSYSHRGREEKLLVRKEAVVTEKDVEFVWADARREISLQFNEAGAARMKAVTSGMVPGHDRMAMVVDGRMVAAPYVQAVPLGASMVVEGLDDLDKEALRDLADKIRGYHLQFIEDASLARFTERPGVKYVEFTEKEYQELKQFREKRGYHYLEKVPTEDELGQSLRLGMSHVEVIKKFGEPHYNGERRVTYELAPERRPADTGGKMYPSGFSIAIGDGKVESWEYHTSNARRNLKPEYPKSIFSQLLESEHDFFAPDFNPAARFEAFKIPDASEAAVKPEDLKEIAMVVVLFAECAETKVAAEGEVDPACDLALVLAHHFPEVALLKTEAGEGKLSLRRLRDALSPYAYGRKELPDPPAKEEGKAQSGH